MSSFRNRSTGVVVSVADDKDDRFGEAWEPIKADEPKKAPKSASSKSKK
jgi:hypothetical protein